MDDGNWVLIDCNDAIVHIFDPEARNKFDLERLWQDAPRIDLGIEGVDPNPAPDNREAGDDAADPAA
jgi:ribosome-associated protein